MKPKKHLPKKSRAADGNHFPPEKSGVSPRRLWLFRICAVVLIPLFILGGLELGLRLAGYGYATSFFLKTKIGGQDYYVPNDKFGYRFFPPALTRTPVALRMAVHKSTNTFRIFLFGESAAQGDPDPTFGAGRYLQTLLRERFPGTDFEVICVAMTAINSHAILPIARECAGRDGDLWIIYMGNNEMVGPFGGGTVFGSKAPGVNLVRADLAVKATRTGQLLNDLIQRWGIHSSVPKTWSGLNMFKNQQLRYDDPNRLRAYENFKENLADILRAGQRTKVPILLSTVGSNLKNCAPFGSLHSMDLSEMQKTEWSGLYQQGVALETNGDFRNALEKYQQAAAIDAHYADLHFRMGSCKLALTNSEPALREFESARDNDTLAFRADSRINQTIQDAAEANAGKGVYFLDAAKALAQNSPQGIPGNELFYEHVHLNFDGNYLLGRAFAEQTLKLLPASVTARDKGEWATPELCDRRLAVSPWDRYRVWQQNFSRVSEPPFTGQLNDVPRAQFYLAKLKALSSQMNDESRKESVAIYREALAHSPDDYFLHGNFAQFLSETGDLPGAINEERKVGELLPQKSMTPYRIGTLLIGLGKTDEAATNFSQALALNPDYVPALNEMGVLLANQQKFGEAEKFFNRALRANPGYVETYLNWGFMEESKGKFNQALAHYRAAAGLQPDGPATYFYQAVTSASEHQRDDAITYFKAAVWMNPKFWQAHYLLGNELVGDGKVEDAGDQFSQVTTLRPDFARAHLNYGVALAKEGKLDSARAEFQKASQLNPADIIARQNLEAVQTNIQVLKK
ncbi:MAG TPA: tetratricopeptide repeat protein [Verrucomicrobiae bacterium]|nr:tetratricopeptide repeat protein [Verrucomicrobiae bacterium]